MWKKFVNKINKFVPVIVILVLALTFFVRVYRIDQILGFYFDQGRDALVIWDLWHNGKFFLIGPTTGIAGIFRGPWYYWLIAPFYLIGKGNPIYPSIFLSLTTVVASYLLYKIGKEIAGNVAGIVAALITSISFYLVYASRWLSNPTPMLLISMLLVWSLLQVIKKKWWAFPLSTFLVGQAMQFGSATEVFLIPALFVFYIWQRKNISFKVLILSGITFVVPFLPQLLFDFRHEHLLLNNIKKFLVDEGSFKLSFWETVKIRLPFYYDVFASKIWPGQKDVMKIFMVFGLISLILKGKELWKKDAFKILILLILAPMVGMLFFQGNEGNVYDYYFTGYYLIFVLLFSILITVWKDQLLGKIAIVIFLFFFIKFNYPITKGYIVSGVDGPTTIALGNQKQAVDWIFQNAKGREFNVDTYVPPVIPYAYEYLYKWIGTTKYGTQPVEKQISLLYTLYEEDPPHPERLEAWMKRQKGIGKVLKEAKFGGITVQERQRTYYGK